MRQWRLIIDSPATGARNMATDEALLASVSAGLHPPTLRLYAWQPACLSLGYGQSVNDVDAERLAQAGWDMVRRPTGGRAILHADELTYSLTLPIEHELAQGDVVASYRRISEALIAALQYLGLSPQSAPQAVSGTKGPVCFEVPSHYEITIGGRKLIGSAQVRRRKGILQHGTFPLWGDIARICDALAFADEAERDVARRKVVDRAITLEAVLGYVVSWQEAAQAFQHGFSQTFNVDLVEEHLTPEEEENAHRLLAETYLAPEWMLKR